MTFLIGQQCGYWVAQCIELDIVAQAKTLSELKSSIVYMLVGHIRLDNEHNKQPFQDVPKTPEWIVNYKKDDRLLSQSIQLNDHLAEIPDCLPPYVNIVIGDIPSEDENPECIM